MVTAEQPGKNCHFRQPRLLTDHTSLSFRILLQFGADINSVSSNPDALMIACFMGQLEMAQMLLEAGADKERSTIQTSPCNLFTLLAMCPAYFSYINFGFLHCFLK